MNISEAHVDLLSRAFEKDPLFVHLNLNSQGHDWSRKLIRFLIQRNRLLDGLILTDHDKAPGYVAIVDRPGDLRSVSVHSKIRLQVEMLRMVFQLPFPVLRFLTKYQNLSFSRAPREPHYYLTMMGVDPALQGKGIGKKVLGDIHEMAGSSPQAYPVALDTENPRNVAYYKSAGYELKAAEMLDGLRIYCMTRPAGR